METFIQNTVLIAGAGVGGLTLANDLTSRGIPVRVIDPLPEPVRDSRAHGFGGRTLLALDKLGLVEPMLAAAKQPPPVLREYFGGTLVGGFDFAAVPHDPYPAMLAIFQQRVVRVLETALIERGHRVEWSTGLTSFDMDDNGVLATVDYRLRRKSERRPQEAWPRCSGRGIGPPNFILRVRSRLESIARHLVVMARQAWFCGRGIQ
jgi:2-polyprenyl-6-methoxyphenol hydroxylase-like FAD-dependent oxidoreductase